MPKFFTLVEVVEMAIAVEKAGKVYYEGVAKRIKDPEMKDLFSFLANEELKHERRFRELGEKIKASPYSLPGKWEEIQPYLQVITDSHFFTGSEKVIKQTEKAKEPKEILEYAIRFEKETILFYYEILGLVKEEDQKIVQEIIAEERSHIKKLGEILVKY